jgi:hypothetical protein
MTARRKPARRDDQVAGTGPDAVGDRDRRRGLDDAEADQVVADAAGQFAAQRVVGGHQQGAGAARGSQVTTVIEDAGRLLGRL